MEKEKMRTLNNAIITGATGAIGIALCNNLIANGIEVFAVCRPKSIRITNLPSSDNLHIIESDICDYHKLAKTIHCDIDAFFHLAWKNTTGTARNDVQSQIDNIRYTIDACRAASELNCKVFIGAGSQAECGRVGGLLCASTPCFPENGYGMAKLCAGQMSRLECEKLGISHIWMRILSVYGPGDSDVSMISSAIRKLLNNEKPRFTPGEQQWDYIYSADAAEALRLSAIYGINGKTYILGSGKIRALREYITIMRDAIDPRLKIGIGEIPYSENQVMILQADISELCSDTGFSPQTTFENGIKETIIWMKNNIQSL